MRLDEEWLLKNGISRETLDKAKAEGSTQQALPFEYPDVTFGPIAREGRTLWIGISGWRPASLNEMAKSVKTKIRLKKRDRAILAEAVRVAGPPANCRATGKRRLSLRIRWPKYQRRFDKDAFWKSTLDACVQAGLLVDDGPVYLDLGRIDYDPERGPLHTTLIFEDLGDGTDRS